MPEFNLTDVAAAIVTICRDRHLDDSEVLESWLFRDLPDAEAIDPDLRALLSSIPNYSDSTHDALIAAIDRVEGTWPDFCYACTLDYDAMSPAQRAMHGCVGEMIVRTCTDCPNV
jgi:hypothetical protein